MNRVYLFVALSGCLALAGCSSARSGGSGYTDHEVFTHSTSINEYDLDVDAKGITYTIDISTPEGRLKLNGLNLKQAQQLALEEAAIMNNAARIVSPKYTYLKKGKNIIRVTVFGFPARYRKSE